MIQTAGQDSYVAQMQAAITAFLMADAAIRQIENTALAAARGDVKARRGNAPPADYLADRLLDDDHTYRKLCAKRAAHRSNAMMYGIAALVTRSVPAEEEFPA